jgi:hypothetical protein
MAGEPSQTTSPLSSRLEELATPYPDRISRLIRRRRLGEAIALTEEMARSRIVLHDFFADTCTVLWSWVGDHLGEEAVEPMFRALFEQSARRQIYSIAPLLRMYVRNTISLLAESGWRSHSCFGCGEHPARFSLTEDDEKFTFHLHPCASGARLWLRGLYEPGRGGKRSEKAHRWTFGQKDFPYYCIHSAFLNELLPYESLGYLLWPTDEPQAPGDICKWHIYKDPNDIPVKYYDRLGVEKKFIPPVTTKWPKKRYFSDDELREMSRPVTDRIKEEIAAGRLKRAVRLCLEVKDEFLFLHDLYVNMIVSTLTFIADQAGEGKLREALEYQFEKAVAPLLEEMRHLPARERAALLALKIFGVDNCNRTGLPRGKFTLKETGRAFLFKLDPCGSGGRLYRGGAYQAMDLRRKGREALVDFLFLTVCKYLPLPEGLLKWSFADTGGYVTQRKPYGQGRTQSGHPWSFHKKGLPLYCCLCGMLQQKLGTGCLTISPPPSPSAPCLWRLEKIAKGPLFQG